MKNKQKTNIPRKYITEQDVLRRHHKFLRQSDSESQSSKSDKQQQRSARKDNKNSYQKYGENLAKKYYSKLYKQYALVDLSRYETGQVGCRWRTEKQVIAEKGQKICGAVNCGVQSKEVYQMNFGYVEQGVKKNALVKISLCHQCARKLNYKKMHKRVEKQKQKQKQQQEEQYHKKQKA